MAPEIRWAVLRAAIEMKIVPPGCLGLLAYLFLMAPERITYDGLTEAIGLSDKPLGAQLKALEAAGFIALKLGRHGKALELRVPSSMPEGVHMVKAGHPDISSQTPLGVHEVRSSSVPEQVEVRSSSVPQAEVRNPDVPGKVEVRSNSVPQNPGTESLRTLQSEFLKGMLDALENGSKPPL